MNNHKPKRCKPTTKLKPRRVETSESALSKEKYVFRLYVAGDTMRSRLAIARARQLCETELPGSYELKVIDIYKQPIMAREGQILATPTLVQECPAPVRRLVGNLTSIKGLCLGLDLESQFKTVR